ncbi:MAG: tRNA uridine-5-carboxymethylaminomethyl(34) synthesis GTPase MnmE [Anaerolineae bacterium]|nr:tRNA uridine-5-carboxymethylaminomethyl(34) synthesis GTPase MnmE [Anaerolineae bacterium]
MVSLDDTIAAISTPIGEGGIGIVRLSGPQALAILRRLFSLGPLQRPDAGACNFEPHHLHYGHITDPATGEVVDEVLAVHMPSPRTYTRQDVVEVDAHGGIVAIRRILALCLEGGARLAEPGEFTLRAFLNGRIDLAQAEAVLDVVQAKTDRALQTAVGQLAGHLSERVKSVRALLLDVLAHVEAGIDFSEDELPVRDIAADLDQAAGALQDLLSSADRGIIYRQGVRAAIVGRPNVGKSSLLNCLLRTSRAIVTDIPGTTRDTLEETLNLKGVPVVLVDTAGIAVATYDPIERLGIERSRQALDQADLAVLVQDASEPPTNADRAIADLIGSKPAIVALNKIDLVQAGEDANLAPILAAPAVPVSALTGRGIDALEEAIIETVLSGQVMASDVPVVSNPRHKERLSRALEHVGAALAAAQDGLTADLVAIDLAAAVHALGQVTGQTTSDDLLENIFSRFCVGK